MLVATVSAVTEGFRVIPSEVEESQDLVLRPGCSGGTRLILGLGYMSDAATANHRLRFLGFARNHYGLAKAAQGDENGVLPGGCESYMSSVPSPTPGPMDTGFCR